MATDFQQKLVRALLGAPNGQLSTTRLAYSLGTSRLAVVSGMRALQRDGRAITWRSDNSRWAAQMWALRKKESSDAQ